MSEVDLVVVVVPAARLRPEEAVARVQDDVVMHPHRTGGRASMVLVDSPALGAVEGVVVDEQMGARPLDRTLGDLDVVVVDPHVVGPLTR